jgi:peptidoglycan/LPS O-acetylase OafA/YrhL
MKPPPPLVATKHLEILDVLRGVAILLVFFYHCLSYSFGINRFAWDGWHRSLSYSPELLLLAPATLGPAGVAIFFVVSGYCIHKSLQGIQVKESRPSMVWLTFSIRRIFRIYPPYLVALPLFAFGDVINGQITSGRELTHQIWTHVALVHNYWENTYYGINPSFWSIAIEAQLYVIFPILFLASKRFSWPQLLTILLIIEFLIRSSHFVGFHIPDMFGRSPLAYWFSWSLGAHIATIRQSSKSTRLASIPLWLPAILFFSTWFIKVLDPYFFPATALFTAAYLARKLNSPAVPATQGRAKRVITRSLSFVGVISYSLYLFHQPLISVWNRILQRVLPHEIPSSLHYFLIIGCLFPILLFSWLCYRWVEKPGIRLGYICLQRMTSRPEPHTISVGS